MLSIIVAKSENNVIGRDNRLIWDMPEDLKRFKAITTGHTIIMGRKTFESIGKVLNNRKHVVLTRDYDFYVDNENVDIVHGLEDIQKYIEDTEEHFLIGGALMYNQLFKKINKMYVTNIKETFDGDAYFPVIKEEEWEVFEKIEHSKDEKNPHDYEFVTYSRKK